MCSPPRVESPPKRDRAERLYVPFWDRPVRKNGAHMIEAKHGHDMTAQLRYQRRAALSCRIGRTAVCNFRIFLVVCRGGKCVGGTVYSGYPA